MPFDRLLIGAGAAMLAFLALAAVSGCQNVPDTVNPFAKTETTKMEVLKSASVPGGDGPYPNLATVPPRPQHAMTTAERAKLVTKLRKDQSTGSGAIRAGRGVGARPGADAREVGLVGFGPGSANLPFSAESVLQQVAAAQKKAGGRIYVVGHAARGSRSGDALALNRAGAIAERLETMGVEAGKIDVTSAGTRVPRARAAGIGGVGGIGDDRAEIYLGG